MPLCVLDGSASFDPQVLSAIQFSTAQDLHGLADIHSYVQHHFFTAASSSAEGWFNRLTGYVAEQKAASFFEQAGHHVVFAPVSNQPVWDMLVDGHPVQIKEHLGGIKDFVHAHANIPVFTDPHLAASLKDSVVHGIGVLHKETIHRATVDTLDGLDGTFDPGLHFPLITMAFSAVREAKLMFKEKTSIERALIHVGMDGVGVSGGMLLGGKVGAIAGSIVPVIGNIIGGILGTILGGIGGKFASASARKMPFHGAKDAYESCVRQAQDAFDGTIRFTQKRIRDFGVSVPE